MTTTDTAELPRPRFTRGDGKGKNSTDRPRSNQRDPAHGRHPTGPYSRWLEQGGSYSSRSREGKFLDACRKELEDHLGGAANMTVGQRILVERICFLRLRAYLFDEEFLKEGKPLGELGYRIYMALSNSLVRATKALGVTPKKSNGTKPSIDSILAKGRAP